MSASQTGDKHDLTPDRNLVKMDEEYDVRLFDCLKMLRLNDLGYRARDWFD